MKNQNDAAISKKLTVNTKMLTRISLLAALSVVFLLVVPRVSLVPAAPYLQYDMAVVPILLAAFLLGTAPGLWVLALVSLIQGVVLGENGLVGAFMHFCATGGQVLVAVYLANKLSGLKGLTLGLLAGSVTRMLIMIPMNLLITVYVFGQPAEIVRAAMLPGIMPFNFLVAAINSVIFFVIYKINEKVFRELVGK
ncbi:MAG: ECF transporter S component [Firmicutes bacterium]|nr:ECF transporter S component [Bacillota bacterium]